MSRTERERREDVAIRLELLRARHGDPESHPESTPNLDPSWGPVGSLARAHMDPATYAYLLALHNNMLALERSRKDPGLTARDVRDPARDVRTEPARIDVDVRLA